MRRHSEREAHRFTPQVVNSLLLEAEEEAWGPSSQGRSSGAATGSSQDFIARLHEFISDFSLKPKIVGTLADLGKIVNHVLQFCLMDEGCRSRSTAGKRDLYPLPVSACSELLPGKCEFFKATTMGLNSLNGTPDSESARGNPTSLRAMKRLSAILEGSEILDQPIPDLDFGEYMKTRKIDYHGEEVKTARKMTWRSISPSLPKEVGQLKLRDFCTDGVLHFVDNFTDFLIPEEEQTIMKTPRVMVDDGEWHEVARGLLDSGLCVTLKESQLYCCKGKCLFNGMFSVGKGEFIEDVETCRLIMNLRPLNAISRALTGDTCTLPSATSLGCLWLDEEETLLTCSEDIRCFFYLFEVPEAWISFLGFGRELPRELVPPNFGEERAFLCARVLPMGYLNSVGIAQHIHRNVVRSAMGSLASPLGGEAELRRDRPFSHSHNLFRVYLDNYDQLMKVDKRTALLLQGQPSEVILGLREAYLDEGLPRHPKKAVESQPCAEVQGAWVNGDKGVASAKPGKIARYVVLALELILRGRASQKELQVVGGGLVYISMFRRPLLCGLNQIWGMITEMETLPSGSRKALKREVVCELARFISLVPLAFMNFRLDFDGQVSASDASTSGGGICISRGLTPYGEAASKSHVRGDVPEEHDFCQVLSIGLFDGIAALKVALDVLGLPLAGHVSVEKSPEASRVVEAFFPDTVFVDNVEDVDLKMCQDWSLRFTGVGIIVIGAGPPCQGVSGLNWDRKGALRDERSSLFHHVPRIVELCKRAFPWAQVHSLAESVASMDATDCETMNHGFDLLPWYIDCDGISPCHRPRLYWVSWELLPGEGVQILEGSDGRLPIQGEVQLKAEFQVKNFLEHGCYRTSDQALPTFTTSRPSEHPLRRPAGIKQCKEHELKRWADDLHRFPPYQYRDENCITTPSGEVRPPSIVEREAMMGFPANYTKQCMSKRFQNTDSHRDSRLTLLGNSWSVPVIAWLLSCLFQLLGVLNPLSLQGIVNRLVPGGGVQLASLLLRPPLGHSTKTLKSSSLLVKKLCGLVSLKGEDILLQSGSDPPVKYHRLRHSIPARLWRWRVVSGWKWTGDPEHINVLELRSVLTTVRWRVEQLRQFDLRCIHLVDSLVVLHSLTRGRSSSRKMRRTMMRICSYLLASGLQPLWGYVATDQNPADRPSRRFVKKRWVKRRWKF